MAYEETETNPKSNKLFLADTDHKNNNNNFEISLMDGVIDCAHPGTCMAASKQFFSSRNVSKFLCAAERTRDLSEMRPLHRT
jgi:hypothetical protein